MVTMDRNTWENAHAGPGHHLRRFKQTGPDGRRVSVVACSCGALLAGLGWWAWRAWR